MSKSVRVDIECKECATTGIYRGFAEPLGVGVICLKCNGTGRVMLEYTPFSGRKSTDGILTVRRSRGSLVAFGVGPTGDEITYQEFLEGRVPG